MKELVQPSLNYWQPLQGAKAGALDRDAAGVLRLGHEGNPAGRACTGISPDFVWLSTH